MIELLPQLFAAATVGVVGLGGWIWRRSVERRERQTDTLIGIHAEIVAGGHSSSLVYEFRDSKFANDHPFATSDRTDFIFDSIKSDISVLPEQVIHSVVRYYRLAEQTNRMTDDLRSEDFASQPKDVRQRFLQKLFITLEAQGRAASRALGEIQEFADLNLPSGTAQILSANRSVTLFRMEELVQP